MYDDRGLGIDQDELKFYLEEYPEMDLEEILDILEAVLLDDQDEEAFIKDGNFTNFINRGQEEEAPMSTKDSIMKRVMGQ